MFNNGSAQQETPIESSQAVLTTNQTVFENNRLLPIPILRRSLPNSPELRARLRANAYKNFSKISASGPEALQILQNIHKLQSLKFAPKLEFDPYLCDISCLKELSLVLKKLKNIKQLSLTIRRLDDPGKDNPIYKMGPNLYKLLRLSKMKLEFPTTPDLAEDHVIALHHALEKCHLLKSFEWVLVEGPIATIKYYACFMRLMKKLQKLEYFKDYTTNKKGIPNADFSFNQGFSNPPKLPRIKSLEAVYSAPREWSDMTEVGDRAVETYSHYLTRHVNLERFKCKMIKSNFAYDDLVTFHKSIQSLPNLWYFEFELLNCQIGDQLLMVVAYSLTLVPQLRYIRFRFIQSSQLSIQDVEQFVDRISKMSHLEKFDLYFRKVNISARQIPYLQTTFSRFRDLTCSFSTQSITVYKNQHLHN